MSRAINTSLATIQFQVDARQASAAMQALQKESDELNQRIDKTKRQIAGLGSGAVKENPQFVELDNQLKGLEKSLKDVQRAQRDFLKGAKAADQLWKAAGEGSIESLSFRSIKAGVNGLRKRQEGLSPGDAQDMKDWRIIKDVIDEADRVVKQAGADVQHVVQTLREGGKVSEQTMRQTISTLKELKGSVDETDADFRTWGNDLDFMEAKMKEFNEAQRRAKGEIVDANDARREMNKLTEEGRRQAEFQKQQAEWEVRFYEQKNQQLEVQRQKQQAAIDQTKQQIDENYKLIEEKHRQLAAYEETFNAEQQGRRESIDGLKQQAEAERKLANEKSDAAETHRRAAELQAQTTEQLTEKVTELQGKLEALNAEPVKPKVDTSEIDKLKKDIESTTDELGTLEQKWEDEIADYIFKKYPTQATVSARTKSPEGLKEREAMKKDPVLAKMYQQQKQELDAVDERLTSLIRKESELKEAQQQDTTATNNLTEAQRLYNEAVERRKQKEQELKEIQERSYNDDPEVKRLDAEIAKLEELIAVSEKYKKQFAKMSDKKFEEGYMGGDKEVQAALHIGSDPRKSIWGAADYLKGAYHDRSRASLLDYVKEHADQVGGEERVAEYQQAADRVAKGIVQNAQENFRRAIYREIQDGNWTSEAMEEQLDTFRSQFQNEFRNARPGQLQDDPEYHYYKYIIEQMEKYIEVAKKVEAERAKIAGGEEYVELAKHKDNIDQPQEGLLWQKEERDWDRATIKTEDIDRRRKDEEYTKSQEVTQAKNDETEAERQLNEEKAKSNQQTEEELRLKGELETTQGKLAESKKRENEEQQQSVKLQGEAIEQGNKAAAAETKLADAQSEATQKQVEFNQKQQEGLDNINQMAQGNQALKTQLEGQEQALADTGKQMAENNQHIAESEAKKKQAQELTIKRMEEMIAALRKENDEVIPANTEKWRENEAEINRLTGALEKMKETARIDLIKTQGAEALSFFEKDATGRSQADTASAAETAERVKALVAYRDVLPKDSDTAVFERINKLIEDNAEAVKIAAGEWMSFADAEKMAQQAALSAKGEGDFIATAQQMQQAQQAVQREYDKTIKSIQKLEQAQTKDQAAIAKEKEKLETLEKELKDLKFEADNFNMSHEKMRRLMKEPVRADNLDELKAAIKRADGELHRMGQTMDKNNKQYKEFAAQVKNAKNQLKEMEGQAKATSTAWEKAWSRLKTYVGMYMGFNMAWQKVTGTADDLLELSDKMGEVRKTTGFTADEVGRLSDNLTKLDTRTGLTGLMEFSSLAGSIGMKTQEQVQGFTEAANMLAVSLPEMGNEASRTLMKIADATGDLEKNGGNVRETLERVGSTIIALRANSAAAAGPITDFVSRVGAVGAQAGISIDQIAALGATVDALGGRVEMSATALSRMIPAIKNNTFEVAKAIGMTEKELKNMTGMEQMVAIFRKLHDSAKGFDTSTEEGMNAMADSVEKALGRSTSMQDVMKELNQQGARAGIVFGLLSQNVDKLEEQLDTASEAYSKNVALMNEYNKMNDTTAAKLERLKNEIEEWFVSDTMQRWLGRLIDSLRALADWFSSDGVLATGFKMMLAYVLALKSGFGSFFTGVGQGFGVIRTAILSGVNVIATAAGSAINSLTGMTNAMRGVRAATIGARREWVKMDAAMKANVIGAVITALGWLALKLWDVHKAAKEAAAETGRFNQQMADEKKALNGLFEPLNKSNMAQEERSKLIKEINSQYGRYLGYMLSEYSSAIQLADAHALIAKRIREEAYERRIAEKEKEVQGEHDEDVNAAYAKITERVRGSVKGGASAQEIADVLKGIVDNRLGEIKYAYDNSGNIFKARTSYYLDPKIKAAIDGGIERLIMDGKLSRDNVTLIQKAVYKYTVEAHEQHREIMNQTANLRSGLRGIQGAIKVDLANNLNTLIRNVANSVSNAVRQVQNKQQSQQTPPYLQRPGSGMPSLFGGSQQGGSSWQAPWQQSHKTTPDQQMAPAGWKPNINKKDVGAVRQFVQDQEALRSALEAGGQQIDEAQRRVAESWLLTDKELKEYKAIIERADRGPGGGNTNPYGDYNKVRSPYSEWNGDDLVARRKEMLERVRALANGADVQKVLSEDAKFISEAVRKNIKTTEQAIEWYNTERLKIQEALHAKHLTNTGDWLDPKKGTKRASRVVNDEIKYYLDELDAYYTERKSKIEEAGTDEGLTEAEIRNRTLSNEIEWQQRRAELQLLYSKKRGEVIEQEQDAIFNIISERTGETTDFIKKDIAQTVKFILAIGDKSKAAMDRIFGDLELGAEKSSLKSQQALTKQMRAIEAIIDKERPFNGITKSLQESLSTMDILTGDMRKEYNELMKQGKDMADFNTRQHQEEMKRTAFLLGEAENAYSTTIDRVMDHMREKGMTAWADWMKQDPKAQEAMMAQLRSTYDQIQDAIKKEASQLKKHAEIMWNNILMPDRKTTLKQQTDRVIAQMGIDENRIKRANSLIDAGQASERVADKLAIQQMKVQLAMQEHYYNLMKKQGQAHVEMLNAQAEAARKRGDIEEATRNTLDAQHAQMSLNLATAKEETELAKQREDIIARTEESQNRLYTELKSWADLLASSVQSIFEASHAGDAEYYNELAKMKLTGKGGPGAGTYIIIDDEGTEDATAHYEYLDERQALERQHEIEQENARAEAWKKVWDDFNNKISETITDQVNAMLQNQSIDANTAELSRLQMKIEEEKGKLEGSISATNANTEATKSNVIATEALTERIDKVINGDATGDTGENAPKTPVVASESRIDYANEELANGTPVTISDQENTDATIRNTEAIDMFTQVLMDKMNATAGGDSFDIGAAKEEYYGTGEVSPEIQKQIDESNLLTGTNIANKQEEVKATTEGNKKELQSNQSMFAKMTQAANLYGVAYQAMSNDNLDTAQKFEMIALQAAGNAAIAGLQVAMSSSTAETAASMPAAAAKSSAQAGPVAGPVLFAILSALVGGLMGLAASKIAKSKSQISQITGASVNAGRLTTGMLTYAEGNVNELTDPSSLTPGRHYNVDGADGRTYRAKYMGKGAKTHITNGPEFHLVGEKGPEAIIDANTTRQIRMDDNGIWKSIQTLYNGGRLSSRRRMGRGMPAFADGNIGDFDDMQTSADEMQPGSTGYDQMAAFQSSLDRNNELLERALRDGIHARFDVYGKGGLIDSYDTGKKNVTSHGERY